jgi:predicted dienelactone hydrolase
MAAALIAGCPLGAIGQELYKADAGPYAVGEREATWHDAARNRDVPVKIYMPRVEEGKKDKGGQAGRPPHMEGEKFPVIVFSHGLGASRETYQYFGEHMASHGYLVIHPQHSGSDTPAVRDELRERMRDPSKKTKEKETGNSDDVEERFRGGMIVENTSDPENLRNRPRDISFVLDQVEKDAELSKVADMTKVAVAGHSFGSYTALAVAGMTVDMPKEDGGRDAHPAGKVERAPTQFADPRVKAAIAMSPQGSGMMGVKAGAWESIHIPTLMLTGTHDMGVGGKAEDFRREAFDDLKGVDSYLVVLKDATHMTFGGKTGPLRAKQEEKYVEEIDAACTAFCDAYVKGDEKALAWLRGGMKTAMEGAVEEKSVAAGGPAPSGH